MSARGFLFIAVFILFAMAGYFIVNPSYERSLEAKYYYETGDFERAYVLAKEAFSQDPYNKMAATIMTQSQYSLKYVRYIQEAKRYIQEIQTIAEDGIDAKDRAKIRLIAQIMIDSYKKLAPSVVVDDTLIQEARAYYEKFKNLLEKARRG